MAAAAADQKRSHTLRLDSIPTVDLRLLSQSELYSLSLCSDSAFDLSRCDDVVIPKIDRSVFNESAGSRKQTYSRLRLAPPESSSTTTTIHRRTSHLRSSHTQPSNIINDPEQSENSQIIRVLKQLFKSDPNFDDMVPIEVEYNKDLVFPELLNPEIKRKRGRPRKHENAVFIRPPAAKRMRISIVKNVVFDNDLDREIMNCRGEKISMKRLADIEDPYGPEIRRMTEGMSTQPELLGFLSSLNGQWGSSRKKRRVVDASDFGDVLPKGWKLSLSIKRREGRAWLFCRRYISPSGRQFESCKEVSIYLLSIIGDEILDKPNHAHSKNGDDIDLRGASGNAADLGVKEDIRRNSPLHNLSSPPTAFPTCPEKQVTLDIGEPIKVQGGELFKCLKCLMIYERKDDLLDHQVLAHNAERSQLGTAIVDWSVVIGGILDCQLCHKTFYERNQYNSHIGSHVNEEIKTTEVSQALPGEKVVDPVLVTGVTAKELPTSVTAEGDVVLEASDAHSCDKPNSASSQNKYEMSSGTESNTDKLVHDLDTLAHAKQDGQVKIDGDILIEESGDKPANKCTTDEVPGTEQAPDVYVSNSDVDLCHEASMCINKSNGKTETSDETKVDCIDDISDCTHEEGGSTPSPNEQMGSAIDVGKEVVGMSTCVDVLNRDAISETGITNVDCVDDKTECILEQGSSRSCQISPFSIDQVDSACGDEKEVVDISTSVEVLNYAVPEIGVPTLSICEKKSFGGKMNDVHICSTSDELRSEKKEVVNSKSPSPFLRSHVPLDEDNATEVKTLSTSPSNSTFIAVNIESQKLSKEQDTPTKRYLGSSTFTPSVNKVVHGFGSNVNQISSGVTSSKLDPQYEVRSNTFDSYGLSGMEGMSTFEEDNLDNGSSISLWKDSYSPVEEPRMQMTLQSSLNENKVEKSSSNKSEETTLDDFQNFRNNESVAPFGSCQNVSKTDALAFNAGKNLEFCSLVPAGNEQSFGFQDDVTGLYDSAMEDCKQELSERGLLNHFCTETSDDIFGNKMYSTPLDGLKFDEDRDVGIHDLSLAFGNPHALYEDAMSVEQKQDLGNCSVPPKIGESFDVQTNLSMVNNSMVDDLKGGTDSVGGLFSLSSNNMTSSYRNTGNTAYPARPFGGLKSDEFRRSEDNKFMTGFGINHGRPNQGGLKSDEFRRSEDNKFMTGFGINHGRPNQEVMPSGMWKTGDADRLQSGIANPTHSQIQSPSCFHSFDIMPEKSENGLFRLDGRYNDRSGVGGLRLGRSEPVEFSFLTGRSENNPNTLQMGSRAFPYNAEIEQGFDSSFWLGKNAMMPNMGSRNQVITSVCAWCRNQFQVQQPVHSGAQTGIGSLCPVCSSGFSPQVNML